MDGLDIVHVQLDEVRGQWSYQILHSDCVPYTETWVNNLRDAANVNVSEFLKLHTSYGRYIGEQVNGFIATHDLEHQVHFIASHGHTVFHEPARAEDARSGRPATGTTCNNVHKWRRTDHIHCDHITVCIYRGRTNDIAGHNTEHIIPIR